MAELLVKIKRDLRPDPSFQDGDVMAALNDRQISGSHVHRICRPEAMGFNSSGLRPAGCLLWAYLEKVSRSKFERVSRTEVKRTILATGVSDILGLLPNHKDEAMDVVLHLQRKTSHPAHKVFGEVGSEFWYGVKTDVSLENLVDVWREIERQTAHRQADCTRWPFTEGELKNYLCLAVGDFSDTEKNTLEEPVADEKDPENPFTIKARKHKIEWDKLPDILAKTITDIAAKGTRVDIRDAVTFDRSTIVKVKG